MTHIPVNRVSTASDRTLPALNGMEALLGRIRQRAQEIAWGRGNGGLGQELDNWLQAERELCDADGELLERDEAYECHVALPGYEPGDVQVTVTPRELLVEAAHKSSTSGGNGGGKGEVRWSEFHDRDAHRRVEFGRDVSVDKVTASLKNGLLTVVLPKSTAPGRKSGGAPSPASP